MKGIFKFRQFFLSLFLCLALVGVDAFADDKGDIDLFFTGDVHGYIAQCGCKVNPAGGLSRRSGYMKSVGTDSDGSLLLDCGDFGSTRSEKEKTKVAHLLKGMAMMGYDAINLGEKDLQYGAEFLQSAQKEHELPFISANVYDKKSGKLFAKPYVIKQINGHKVGIFGIETDAANPRLVRSGFEAKDPVAAAKEMAEKLGQKCDVVIALAHIGLAKAKELANQVTGIDFIVSGYRWDKTYSPVTVGETVIMQSGTQGKYMGHITFNLKNNKASMVSGKLVNLNSKIADDQRFTDFVDEYDAATKSKASGTN